MSEVRDGLRNFQTYYWYSAGPKIVQMRCTNLLQQFVTCMFDAVRASKGSG